MSPSARGLGLVLTSWVVASPASSIHTGLLGSGWWGTKEAPALRQAVPTPNTLTGESAESERVFRRASHLTPACPHGEGYRRLEMRLAEMGTPVGIGYSVINAENFPSHDSLSLFRESLRDFEVLLSFCLGVREAAKQLQGATNAF
jgi:hypothetical protein